MGGNLIAGPLPTQHTTNTKHENPFLSGVRTRDPNSRAAADLRLRPHGYRDHQDQGKMQNKPILQLVSYAPWKSP